jgi:hypothetical protein
MRLLELVELVIMKVNLVLMKGVVVLMNRFVC